MKTLGLDVHSATFTMAIFSDRGRFMQFDSGETSEKSLIEAVQAYRGSKTLIVEECHLAQWVKRTLEPFVDRLVIADPKRNEWIARDDFVDDPTSARKLGHLWLGGFIKEIHHQDDGGAYLRALFIHYYDLTKQGVRFKNKLKAIFRQVAIKTHGRGVYRANDKKQWLDRLKDWPELRLEAKHAYENIERLEDQRAEVLRSMRKKVKHQSAFKNLATIPGVGDVIAIGYLALIGTPHRFSRKNRLWRYACLGNCYHKSDDRIYKDRPSVTGNRVLKWLVYRQFDGALRCNKPNRFTKSFGDYVSRGLGKKTARRHVCRSMLSIVRAVWLKGEAYRE